MVSDFFFCLLSLSLTSFLVENQFGLEFPSVIQSALDLGRQLVTCLRPIQKVARTALLHQLSASVACQLTEPIRAVHDGVEGLYLGIPQHKVAICNKHRKGLWEFVILHALEAVLYERFPV